jgi:hypothetical protein
MTFVIALATVTSLGGSARAEPGAVLVSGKGAAGDNKIMQNAAAEAFKSAGWTVVDAAFTDKETSAVAGCVTSPTPWSCSSHVARDKGARWLAVVSLTPQQTRDGGKTVQIAERVIVANTDSIFVGLRFCDHCTDDTLATLTGEVTREVIGSVSLSGGRTVLSVKSTPQHAQFFVDGNSAGATDAAIDVVPGSHTVTIEHEGFESATRTVAAVEGKTAEVSVTLRPVSKDGHGSPKPTDDHGVQSATGQAKNDDGRPPPSGPSRLVPTIVIGVGVLALVGGTAISWTAKDPTTGPQHENLYSGPGIGLAAAGAAAVGVGVYLLLRHHDDPSGPTVLLAPGGAVAGWTTRF